MSQFFSGSPVSAMLHAPCKIALPSADCADRSASDAVCNQLSCVSICTVAGAQKELDLWPVFLVLLKLLPGQSVSLVFVSPDVPATLDGHHRSFTCPSEHMVDAVADRTAATSDLSVEQDSPIAINQPSPAAQSQSAFGPSGSHTANAVADSSQATAAAGMDGAASNQPASTSQAKDMLNLQRQQQQQQQGSKSGQMGTGDQQPQSCDPRGCIQLRFHKGLYHDVAQRLTGSYGTPDLVFGANAGESFIPLQ